MDNYKKVLLKRFIAQEKSARWATDSFQATTLEELLDRATVNAVYQFKNSICLLLLVEEDCLVVKSASGLDLEKVEHKRIPVGTSLSGRIVKEGEPKMFDDVSKVLASVDDNQEPYYTGSMISTPLVFNRKVIGLLNIYRPGPQAPFSFDDFNIFITYGSQTAFAIESQKLVDKRTAELKEAQAILVKLNEQLRQDMEARRRAEEQYRMILSTTIDGFWIVDTQGRFLDVNDAYCRLIGYSRDELLKMTIRDVEATEMAEEIAQRIQKIMTAGGDRFETSHRGKDEKLVNIEISVNYSQVEGGRFFVFLRDITSRKKAEKELKTAYEQLKTTQIQLIQSAKMASVGLLAGGVAHEINNPLTGVLNNVQLIKMLAEQKEDFSFQDFKELLGVIEESAVRCKKITQSLLDFSHTSKGVSQPILLNVIVDKVVALIGHELKLQDINIRQDLQPDLPQVLGDPQLLQQVVFDFISNARWAIQQKSSKGEGTITLTTRCDPGNRNICLSISDTGIGIAKENLATIFEPFFTTKAVGEGTGLGLSIVYGIIKAHRGSIEVDSRVGEGTTFKIYLPLA